MTLLAVRLAGSTCAYCIIVAVDRETLKQKKGNLLLQAVDRTLSFPILNFNMTYEYDGPTPLNREPTTSALIAQFHTPADVAYDRNHGAIPQLSASSHKVLVHGLVSRPLSLSPHQLATEFPQHTVSCALQCAGNRRHTMRTALKEVSGVDWGDGAVMNATWEGPRLSDVLARAGAARQPESEGLGKGPDTALHVAFECSVPTQDDSFYGGSIPLERALRESAEVVLALRMNGQALTPKHGFPVRAVVPGALGARSVKWLSEIKVQKEESRCFYQRHDYKALPSHVLTMDQAREEGWWERTPALLDMPVNSVIASPEKNAKVERDDTGKVEIKGYALPAGEDGPIVRVELRVDQGEWEDAEILNGSAEKWCWCLWRWKGKVERGKRRFWSRASDKAGNKQKSERSEWNVRGVAYSGYGELELDII